MMRAITRFLNAFRRGEDGSITVEAVLILPLLFWAYAGIFVFFDAFHKRDADLKAAYTISDLVGRQTDYVTPKFMDGIYALHRTLTHATGNSTLRVTAYSYNATTDSYTVRWSKHRGLGLDLTTSDLNNMRANLPAMPNGEVNFMVEVSNEYIPPLNTGLGTITFRDLIPSRMRYAPQLCWNDREDGNLDTAVC